MELFDLHIHTTYSDGDLTPIAIMEKAKREGVSVISITDHETIRGYIENYQYAKNYGLTLIPGVEINVGDYVGFHFVGYGMKNVEKLEYILLQRRVENQSAAFKTLELLKREYNIEFSVQDLTKKYSKDQILDKKAIAKALIDGGFCMGVKEAYDNFIGPNAKAYSPIKKFCAKDVIDIIHLCGGICVWAHPQITKFKKDGKEFFFSAEDISRIAGQLKIDGLDGIEVNTSCSQEQRDWMKKMARKYGLLITSGTDFHSLQGEKSPKKLGCEYFDSVDQNAFLSQVCPEKANHDVEGE